MGGGAGGGDRAVVGADDGLDHGEPEAGAIGFGGDEGVEDFGKEFLWNSFAGVGDSELEIVIISLNGESESAAVGHSISGILNEIDEDLAELVGVRLDGGAVVLA